MMVMTSSVPSFTHEDGTVSNTLMYGESRMFVNASGELGNLDLGAEVRMKREVKQGTSSRKGHHEDDA